MSIKKPVSYLKWEFRNAKLKKSFPEDIIQEQNDNKEENEFRENILALSLIFNDAKNIALLNDTINDLYAVEKQTTVSDNNGELTGLRLYFARLLFGTLHESLNYLNEKRGVFESVKFITLTESLSKNDQLKWKLISKIAFNEKVDTDEFKSEFMDETKDLVDLIQAIRNNITFHYQTKKRLAGGYKNFFFERQSNETNQFAWRSLQKTNFSETRYYYADAAIEGYFNELLNGKYSIQEFTDKALGISALLCYSINSILNSFFEKLPNR